MTEKRFEMVITGADGSFHYLDKNTGEKITSTLELENKLNELHEENQSSKEFIEQLQQELVLFKKAGADMGIDLNAQITALKQENENAVNALWNELNSMKARQEAWEELKKGK